MDNRRGERGRERTIGGRWGGREDSIHACTFCPTGHAVVCHQAHESPTEGQGAVLQQLGTGAADPTGSPQSPATCTPPLLILPLLPPPSLLSSSSPSHPTSIPPLLLFPPPSLPPPPSSIPPLPPLPPSSMTWTIRLQWRRWTF